MEKIVLLVGEHKNETSLHAKQLKERLEARGHDVQIVPAGVEPSLFALAIQLYNASTQKEAFKIISAFVGRNQARMKLFQTHRFLVNRARDFPGAHVFTLHTTPNDTYLEYKPSLQAASIRSEGLHPRPAFGKVQEGSDELKKALRRNSSVVSYNYVGRKPRAIGIIESLADYKRYEFTKDESPSFKDDPIEFWPRAIRTSQRWLDKWKSSRRGDGRLLAAENLSRNINHYCRRYSVNATGVLAQPAHIESLADAIDQVVRNAGPVKRKN